jgi:hypothetical protein
LLSILILSSAAKAVTIPNIQFKDKPGKTYASEKIFSQPTLVFFTGSDCPISKRQKSKITNLIGKYRSKYNILLVETSGKKSAISAGSPVIQVNDSQLRLARLLGATTTTESFLIDKNEIIYHGAIDNQFTFSGSKPGATVNFLVSALSGLESGHPKKFETASFGCYISTGEDTAPDFSASDFTKQIQPILVNRCMNCHSKNNATPDLSNEETLNRFKPMIHYTVKNNIMPPWFAVGGNWLNDLSLNESEKNELLKWSASKGYNTFNSPAPLKPVSQNSDVFEVKEYNLATVKIPAHEFAGYKYFKLKLNNADDIWIDLVKLKSELPDSFHHALVFARPVDLPAQRGFYEKKSARNGVGFYAHGIEYVRQQTSAGILLPKNSVLYLQAHYEPTGTAATDHLKLVLSKFKTKPDHMLSIRSLIATDDRIKIPPNTKDFPVELEMPAPANGTIQAAHAHMHYRGHRFLMTVSSPKRTEEILRIDNFNYKMQLLYQLKNPVEVTKDDVIKTTVWFDNSASNPDNPDPNATVTGGERANDEMIFGTYFLVSKTEESEPSFREYWSRGKN